MTQALAREARRGDRIRLVGLCGLAIAPFMAVLDVFIVNVAAPSIQQDLGSGLDEIQLVLGVYLLTFAMGLVTCGRIGDSFGRRRMFLLGLALFALTSVGCAVSGSAPMLIGARALQGLSAAVMMPQVLAIVQVLVPPDERPRVLGAYGAAQSLGAITGQIAGGVLVELDAVSLGWRSIFLVNVPMCALAWLGTAIAVPKDTGARRVSVDVPGVLLLSAALLMLLYPLVVGADRGWPLWSVLVPAASLVAFALFWAWEKALSRRDGWALLPPRLFRDSAFAHGVPAALALYIGNIGFYLVLTFYLQDGLRLTPLGAAIEFLPLGTAFALASLGSRRLLTATGGRILPWGALIITGGLLAVAAGTGVVPGIAGPLALQPGLVLCGIGQGVVIPALIGSVLARVNPDDAGAASGSLLTLSQIGNVVGVAVIGTLFRSLLAVATYAWAFRISMIVLAGISIVLYAVLVRLRARSVHAA
jgi:MFS family permease